MPDAAGLFKPDFIIRPSSGAEASLEEGVLDDAAFGHEKSGCTRESSPAPRTGNVAG